MECLWVTALSSQPDGLRIHIAELFLAELIKLEPQLPTEPLLCLLQPFLQLLKTQTHKLLVKRTADDMIMPIILNVLTAYAGHVIAAQENNEAPPQLTEEEISQIAASIPLSNTNLFALREILFDIASDP